MMKHAPKRRHLRARGSAFIEYSLTVALVCGVAVVSLSALGQALNDKSWDITTQIAAAGDIHK